MFSPNTADFIAGTAAGISGTLAGHPFDTLKVRLQIQKIMNFRTPLMSGGVSSPVIYKNTLDCAITIMREEGLRGLYKGVIPPTFLCSSLNSVAFGTYGFITRQISKKGEPTLKTIFLAGCGAGVTQNIIATPMELVKIRLQMQQGHQKPSFSTYNFLQSSSSLQCISQLLKKNGPRILYRGFFATLLRDIPGFATYFTSYEYLRRKWAKNQGQNSYSEPIQILLAGGLGGMISWVVSYPFDVVKSFIQAAPSKVTYFEAVKEIYREGGYRAFARGLTPTLIRAFPVNAVMFASYEIFLYYLTDSHSNNRWNQSSNEQNKLH